MGEVWLAYDKDLDGRPVAIKKMHPHMLADAEDMARFQRELRIAARMQHPNIMTMFTTGNDNGVPFMVMEYLEGSDLGKVPPGWPADEVARIGREACSALAYAHGLTPGVIHRDIKPANLFICGTGLVKVMDFGIAKAVGGSKLSATGTLIGTLPYMAPEQWLGEPAAFGNDVWAVGCVLYELLSGRLARSYPTPTEYVAAAARREGVAPLPGGVPGWLAYAVTMMLQPDPVQRPTAAQCVQLLAGPTAYQPPAPWSARVSQPNSPWQSPPPQPPVSVRQPAPSAAARQVPVSPATASSTFGAFAGGTLQPPAAVVQRPVTIGPLATTASPSRRGFLIVAGGTGLAAVGAVTAWKLLGSGSQQSPGSGSGAGAGAGSGALLSKLPTNTSVNSVAFRHDGLVLADGSGGNGSEGTVELWNVANPAHPVALGKPLTGLTYVNAVAFSPDGRTLASGNGPGTIQLWNVTDPANPVVLGKALTAPAQVVTVAFSPDGQILAAGSAPGGPVAGAIRLWNVANPAHPVALGSPAVTSAYEVNSLVFSPHGRTLASASASIPALVQLWNVADSAHVTLAGQATVDNGVLSVAFSPDGHTLAGAGGDVSSSGGASSSAIQLWNVTDPTHPAALGGPLAGPTTPFTSVAFSPSGHTLAAGSGSPTFTAGAIQRWDVADLSHPTALGSPLNDDGGAIAAVAFSPDGLVLAGGNGNSRVDLWDVG
jgi:WD40 repeat protein